MGDDARGWCKWNFEDWTGCNVTACVWDARGNFFCSSVFLVCLASWSLMAGHQSLTSSNIGRIFSSLGSSPVQPILLFTVFISIRPGL